VVFAAVYPMSQRGEIPVCSFFWAVTVIPGTVSLADCLMDFTRSVYLVSQIRTLTYGVEDRKVEQVVIRTFKRMTNAKDGNEVEDERGHLHERWKDL
jgi:hypothetical protein